ncbi:hypothetical protein TNIN_408851 [Trichonephila inaurata madagascariensis]|uniref:Uncharacterized protein n=1 Tax=Trichonephila inaurata madagascariensis TaxID=2747483 RepID=A0A8X7C1V7_9ARAC|nr:hypothetical protein TNIN_408851 [Trichonephila inaurata madagascariensis]
MHGNYPQQTQIYIASPGIAGDNYANCHIAIASAGALKVTIDISLITWENGAEMLFRNFNNRFGPVFRRLVYLTLNEIAVIILGCESKICRKHFQSLDPRKYRTWGKLRSNKKHLTSRIERCVEGG